MTLDESIQGLRLQVIRRAEGGGEEGAAAVIVFHAPVVRHWWSHRPGV